MNLLFGITLIIIVLFSVIFTKLVSLGMPKINALVRSLLFPFRITKIHYRLFLRYKNNGIREALFVILYPIVKLPDAIISYGEMYIRKDTIMIAIQELVDELDENKRNELLDILVKNGIIKKVEEKRTYKEKKDIKLNDSNEDYLNQVLTKVYG